ncbi:Rho protein GDP-dissociation inhibitor protein [Dioscorea alata]|uniref:Rho protein GDP-dissociation inhibitor protein n=1 Tax=Dioscorea alata TaxID=55571 RepID=A0ACB7WMV9_DIOAL|nr:Rho protein GDP-dissociation inhibitor protein [Dioscorea alata]
MSLAVGALSNCSQDMGFDENKDKNGVLARKEVDEKRCEAKCEQEKEQDKLNLSLNLNLNIPRKLSEASLYATEDEEEEEEEDDEEKGIEGLDLGPQLSLKDQFEKDKDDESLRRWKEQLLGSVDLTSVGVDSTKEMLGTFSPQVEPYICEVPEDTTPSGIFARGSYSAKTKFVDDDGKCYLELNYTFDIRKEWSSIMD